MSRMNVLRTFAALLTALVLAPAFAGGVTVGRFYAELAAAKQLNHGDAASADASLHAAGFNMPVLELDKALTEGDVVSIARALGLKVTTSRPASPLTEAQMTQFVATIVAPMSRDGAQPPIQGGGTGGIDPGNSGNGKGKKKGHNKSGSEPL